MSPALIVTAISADAEKLALKFSNLDWEGERAHTVLESSTRAARTVANDDSFQPLIFSLNGIESST
jgi:hypothetical protein